jgi:hypothetical protein
MKLNKRSPILYGGIYFPALLMTPVMLVQPKWDIIGQNNVNKKIPHCKINYSDKIIYN